MKNVLYLALSLLRLPLPWRQTVRQTFNTLPAVVYGLIWSVLVGCTDAVKGLVTPAANRVTGRRHQLLMAPWLEATR